MLGASANAVAQVEAAADTAKPELAFSAYVDAYYAYDFGHPRSDNRPAFLYQYNRHNEVDLNLGMARVDYARDRVRAALGLMLGTYPQANTIQEPELLRNIYEARVGFKLSKKRELWLDAGVFTSHIGLESAVGIENYTLTRSVNAENSPYYLSGAKLTWTISPKLEVAGLFVNGWQRMRRIQDRTPCFGTQMLWSMKKDMKFNWSTFLGSDTPDSLGLYRVFNNFWWSWEGKKWGFQVAGDIGFQEKYRSTGWNSWAGAVAMLRRAVGTRFHIVGRSEYYADPDQVMVATGKTFGLSTFGYSLGVDLLVATNAMVRLEGRTFHGTDRVFENIYGPTPDNTSITISMAAKF